MEAVAIAGPVDGFVDFCVVSQQPARNIARNAANAKKFRQWNDDFAVFILVVLLVVDFSGYKKHQGSCVLLTKAMRLLSGDHDGTFIVPCPPYT